MVEVSQFRHEMGPGLQEWKVKNISNRYRPAGVQPFAFLLPKGSQISPMMNQSSPSEKVATRAFTDLDEAKSWLSEAAQGWAAD